MLSIVKKISGFLKKVFLVVAVYCVVINLFFYFFSSSKTNNQNNQYQVKIQNERKKIYQELNDPKLNATVSDQIGNLLYRTTLCLTIGEACTDNPDDAKENIKHTPIGFLSNLIVLPLSSPPASGLYWAYSGLEQAGFIPKTYAAQGIGFGALKPFKDIWLVFRDVVMLLMVFFIIAIGFMIMFRSKINPQTVISIENSLPKIVVALILITFSYAIAGFLIDLMYIVMGVILFLFASSNKFGLSTTELMKTYFYSSTSTPWVSLAPVAKWSNFWQISGAILNLLPQVIVHALNSVVMIFGTKILLGLLGGATHKIGNLDPLKSGNLIIKSASKFLTTGKLTQALEKINTSGTPAVSLVVAIVIVIVELAVSILLQGYAAKILLTVILFLSIVFIYFRIFFLLLSTYLNILLSIIFSPLILALEAIPGKSSFSYWIKNLLLNLATFPIVVTLALISYIISTISPSGAEAMWKPPYLLSIDSGSFQTILAAMILFSIPDLVKTVRELTGVKPLPINLGIGALFGGAGAAGGGAMGLLGQFSTLSLGLQGMGRVGEMLGMSKKGIPGGDISGAVGGSTHATLPPSGVQHPPAQR